MKMTGMDAMILVFWMLSFSYHQLMKFMSARYLCCKVTCSFYIYLFKLEAHYFTILFWFLPYIDMSQPCVYMCPTFWIPLPLPSLSNSSGSSRCTGPERPVSRIEPGLTIYFSCGNIHVSMRLSQIIPPSPSPKQPNSLFFISVSLLLSCI